jgi:signal transduction histidine kinase
MAHFQPLGEFLTHHKKHLIHELNHRLGELPFSPYQEFIVRTEEGQRRLSIWADLVIRSLKGEQEAFFKDEERVGYSRAVQGFQIDFSFQIHRYFQQIVWKMLQEATLKKNIAMLNLIEQIQELNEILFKGCSIIAASFLKTREELIHEKMLHLQEIFNLTQEIITIFDLEEIIDLILRKLTDFFGVEQSFLLLYQGNQRQGIYSYPSGLQNQGNRQIEIMKKTLKKGIPLFINEDGNIYTDVGQGQFKRVVVVPVQAHGKRYGVLTLLSQRRGFRFLEKELNLLLQFIHITAIALENAFMLKEIEAQRQESHLLASKMITIGEEERKRLAGDIHDTLAQALTGISYKIQYCKELAKNNPQWVNGQLDTLLKTVNHTIDQARDLISSLRPDLIDMMGLVPALRKHIDNFMRETGIVVHSHLFQKIQVPSELSICLFRVAQEALMNIYKHANATTAEVTLKYLNGNLHLIVADHGKGFDMSQGSLRKKDQSPLGLLSMKQRIEAVKGMLVIDTDINKGCRIEAKVPLCMEAHHHDKGNDR